MLEILEIVHAVKSNTIENIFYGRPQGILFMKEPWKKFRNLKKLEGLVLIYKMFKDHTSNGFKYLENDLNSLFRNMAMEIHILHFFIFLLGTLCIKTNKTFQIRFPLQSLLSPESSILYTILDILEGRVPVKY